MKILVAIDGSRHALSALEGLVAKLGFFRDAPQVTLIHVDLPVPYKAATAWVGKDVVETYHREESEAALAGAAAFLSARAIPFQSARRVGDPAEEIVRFATDEHFDMIAMGTCGHTALANLVMGSVATKVLALSRIPVLLLK